MSGTADSRAGVSVGKRQRPAAAVVDDPEAGPHGGQGGLQLVQLGAGEEKDAEARTRLLAQLQKRVSGRGLATYTTRPLFSST